MSNADVVRRWYAAIATGDFDTARGLAAPDIDFNVAYGFPAGGRYHGHDDLFDGFYPSSFVFWETIVVEADEFIECGETVVSLGRYVGRTATGSDFAAPFAHVSRVRDGRLINVAQYVDTLLLDRAIGGRPLAPAAERSWNVRVPGTPAG